MATKTQLECRVEHCEIGETLYETERIENAYQAAGLAVGRLGIRVHPFLRVDASPSGQIHWLVVDSHRSKRYETVDAAIADLDNWRG